MRSIDTRGDTPTMETDDALKVDVIENPFQFRAVANDSGLVSTLVDAINLMGGAGECADDDYQAVLDKLRRKNKAACRALVEEYQELAEDRYLDRWSMVMLLAELRDRDCAEFFAKILEAKIPEERSKTPPSFTTVGEEVMIRTTAVEALERMAAEGHEGATEILWRNIGHEVFSIRRAAVQALVATGGEDVHAQLAERLPSRHRDLLKIVRRDVRKIEQAEGGLFLKQRDEDGTPEPNDECGDGKSGGGKKRDDGDDDCGCKD